MAVDQAQISAEPPAGDAVDADAAHAERVRRLAFSAILLTTLLAALDSVLLSGMHLVFLVTALVGLVGIGCAFALEERTLSTQRH